MVEINIHSILRTLPYCSLYDEGFRRLGCICCPMGREKGQLRDAERWPKFKAQYIRTFQRMVDKRIADGLKTQWRTGQDVWDWWVSHKEKGKEENEAQLTIFEG